MDPSPGAPGGHGQVKVLVIVSSHGLDLTSDAGADQFLGRLTAAVNHACDDRPADGPPLTHACRRVATVKWAPARPPSTRGPTRLMAYQ